MHPRPMLKNGCDRIKHFARDIRKERNGSNFFTVGFNDCSLGWSTTTPNLKQRQHRLPCHCQKLLQVEYRDDAGNPRDQKKFQS